MSRREAGLAALAWCVVVVVVATLVWTVVDRAGQSVVGSGNHREVATQPAAPGTRRTTGPGAGSSSSRSARPSPVASRSTAGPGGAGTRRPSGPATATLSSADPTITDPTTGPTHVGPTTGPTSAPTTHPTSSLPNGHPGGPHRSPHLHQGHVHHRRAWTGPPGLVIGDCGGATIRLVAAQAQPGWLVQVRRSGPHRLEVVFTASDDTSEIDLVGHCVRGRPVFRSHSHHLGNSGHG